MAGPIRADSIQPEAVEWLWRDRIPRRMITIVAGRADQGKGLFCAYVAAEVSRTRFTDPTTGETRWGNVLYSAIEDSHALMTRPRLESAGANLNHVDLWRFRLPVMMRELEVHLTSKPIDLLVIDPLASHLSGNISRHSDNIRTVTDPLAELIEQTGTAVIIVEHVLKRVSENSHPLSAIGGSGSGIVAAARMAFLFGTDPSDEDRKLLCCAKHNISEKPPEVSFIVDTRDVEPVGDVPHLMYDDEVAFDPMRFLAVKKDSKMGRPPDKKAAACEYLTNFLYEAWHHGVAATKDEPAIAPGPVPAGRVFEDAKHFGMNAKTLRRAAQDMDIVRNPPGGGRNCTWELGTDILDQLDQANGVNVATPPIDGADPVPAADVGMLTDADFQALLNDNKDSDGDG